MHAIMPSTHKPSHIEASSQSHHILRLITVEFQLQTSQRYPISSGRIGHRLSTVGTFVLVILSPIEAICIIEIVFFWFLHSLTGCMCLSCSRLPSTRRPKTASTLTLLTNRDLRMIIVFGKIFLFERNDTLWDKDNTHIL